MPFLKNKKICYISLKGRKFGDRPINISVKLEVEDSPNSAGVVIDLIRAAKIALDRKIAGALLSMPSYAFKHPPIQVPDSQARQWTEDWIAGKRNAKPIFFFIKPFMLDANLVTYQRLEGSMSW